MNQGFVYREQLGRQADGSTLIAYLCRRYPHSDAAQWAQRIHAGQVTLDDHAADVDQRLRPGQRLSWHRPPWREPEVPLAYTVIHRDAGLLAVAKPAGLPTLPGGGFLDHTLLARVRRDEPDAVPAHRLGRFTSGLVLFALTGTARSRLARAWRRGEVVRAYRALAQGCPSRRRFAVEIPIGRVPHPLIDGLHAADPDGKRARSIVEVLERRDRTFLARVTLDTGRPHQIRIHLSAAGHPLVGEPLYRVGGRPAPGAAVLPGAPGYCLHAGRLELKHPETGVPLSLRCSPPPALVLDGAQNL